VVATAAAVVMGAGGVRAAVRAVFFFFLCWSGAAPAGDGVGVGSDHLSFLSRCVCAAVDVDVRSRRDAGCVAVCALWWVPRLVLRAGGFFCLLRPQHAGGSAADGGQAGQAGGPRRWQLVRFCSPCRWGEADCFALSASAVVARLVFFLTLLVERHACGGAWTRPHPASALLVGGAGPLWGGRLCRLPGVFQTRGIGQRGDAQILIPFKPILEDYKAGTFSSSSLRDVLSLAPAPPFSLVSSS